MLARSLPLGQTAIKPDITNVMVNVNVF